MTIELTTSADTPEHAELRRAVRTLRKQFGEKYWQQRDLNREYPEEFVDTLNPPLWPLWSNPYCIRRRKPPGSS